ALAMCLEHSLALRTEARVTQIGRLDRSEVGVGRQQTAAQRVIRAPGKFQLAGHDMHPRLATGEQIQLLVRLDQLIGMGPGVARHGGLRKGGATLAQSRRREKPQSRGSSTGQRLSSRRPCASAVGWMPSACIMPSTPPTPARKKGTQGSRYSSASSANTCSKARV